MRLFITERGDVINPDNVCWAELKFSADKPFIRYIFGDNVYIETYHLTQEDAEKELEQFKKHCITYSSQ